MAVPFLIGLGWSLRRWRRPAAAALLLWVFTMLGPTILANDAPHFLRASGIFPAAMLLPALGLAWLWQWPRLPRAPRQVLVIVLLTGSTLLTWRDYHAYGRNPETDLLFEAAATEMAAQLRAELEGTSIYLDRWYWDESTEKGWPSIPYLANLRDVTWFRPEFGLPPPPPGTPIALYTWPFGDREFVPAMLADAALVEISAGQPARNDLETESYPLTAIYRTAVPPSVWPLALSFGNQFSLHAVDVDQLTPTSLAVTLVWSAAVDAPDPLVGFVQVVADKAIGQLDVRPGGVHWLNHWWRQNQFIRETRLISLGHPFDQEVHTIQIGLYDPLTGERVPISNARGDLIGDSWSWQP